MRNKREEDAEFWALNGIDPPWMYFGADDGGSFRIYPGRQSESCGTYDPRSRPWYVAGSSGRKDIVLVLDTASGGEYSLDLIKEAARGVVRTLGAGDRVGVVSFGYGGSTRMAVDGTDLASAGRENKERLLGEIGRLEGEAAGRDGDVKDVHEAFDLAFGAFGSKAGQEEEVRPGCNAAVVFITDGKMTAWDGGSNATAVAMEVASNATAAVTEEGSNATAAVTEGTSNATAAMTEGGSNATAVATEEGSNATTAMTAAGTNVTAALMEEDAIVDLIARGKAVVEARTGRRLTVFAYSPGENGNNDVDDDGGDRIRGRSSFPKRVACATGGIWTPVEDGRDLAKRVSAYHRAFASPLNATGVDDGGVGAFTAWAEPYEFATGPGLLGTTVSAPVYDRSGGFVGVAGMDFALDSLLRAGGGAGAVVRRWADRCPPGLDLSGCRMGALRLRAGGEERVPLRRRRERRLRGLRRRRRVRASRLSRRVGPRPPEGLVGELRERGFAVRGARLLSGGRDRSLGPVLTEGGGRGGSGGRGGNHQGSRELSSHRAHSRGFGGRARGHSPSLQEENTPG